MKAVLKASSRSLERKLLIYSAEQLQTWAMAFMFTDTSSLWALAAGILVKFSEFYTVLNSAKVLNFLLSFTRAYVFPGAISLSASSPPIIDGAVSFLKKLPK